MTSLGDSLVASTLASSQWIIYDESLQPLQSYQAAALSRGCSPSNDLDCSRISLENLSTSTTSPGPEANTTRAAPAEDEYAFVWRYVSPVILLLGIVGNTLTLLVMRRRRLRSTTTSVYLSLMSVADSLALITRICPEFFQSLHLFTFSKLSRWTCKLEKFAFYSSSDVAIWLLVAFTFDRLIAVCFPLQKRRVCVPRKACIAAIVITTLAVAKNSHVFWSRDVLAVTQFTCGWVAPFLYFEEFVRPWIAFTLVSAVPFTFILVCNCLIVRTLTIVGRLGSATTTAAVSSRRTTSFTQTSWMCLSVSLTFLACVTPSIVLSIGRAYWSRGSHRHVYVIARAINNQLACANHAVNFFLYCLTGQRFRSELLRMFNVGPGSSVIGAVTGAVGGEMGSMTALGGPNSYWSNNGVLGGAGGRNLIYSSSSQLAAQNIRVVTGGGGRTIVSGRIFDRYRRAVTS